MIVEWIPSLAVGIPSIDDQHKELYRRIDALLVAMKQGRGKSEIDRTVIFLEEYVTTHFGDEERTMTQANYPALATHRREHTAFVNDLAKWKRKLEKGENALTLMVDLQSRLTGWLNTHIGRADKEFGEFSRKKDEQKKGAGAASAPKPPASGAQPLPNSVRGKAV